MLEADVIKWWYVDENLPFRNKKFATVLSARNISNVSAPGDMVEMLQQIFPQNY